MKVVSVTDHCRIIGFWKGTGRETVRVSPFLSLYLIFFVIAYNYVIDYSMVVYRDTVEDFIVILPSSL